MSFEYRQATGQMSNSDSENGAKYFGATGYSGNGKGLNNPAMQQIHGVGPLPQGVYTILPAHTDAKVGPVAMRLVPAAGNQMFRRCDFLIHGDNAHANDSASEGCIVLGPTARAAIAKAVLAGDDQLTVTA